MRATYRSVCFVISYTVSGEIDTQKKKAHNDVGRLCFGDGRLIWSLLYIRSTHGELVYLKLNNRIVTNDSYTSVINEAWFM